MLVIEIALGIVLAVVVLSYWRLIITFGIIGVIGLAVIAVIIFGGYMIYENYDSLIEPFLIIIFVLVLMFVLYVVLNLIESTIARINTVTLKKWNLLFWEIVVTLFLLFTMLTGVYFIYIAAFSGGGIENYSIGIIWILVCAIYGFFCIKDIKNEREKRALSIKAE